MDKVLFERLTQSMSQMNEIIEGPVSLLRTFFILMQMKIKEIRQASACRNLKFVNPDFGQRGYAAQLGSKEDVHRQPASVTSRAILPTTHVMPSIALLS